MILNSLIGVFIGCAILKSKSIVNRIFGWLIAIISASMFVGLVRKDSVMVLITLVMDELRITRLALIIVLLFINCISLYLKFKRERGISSDKQR